MSRKAFTLAEILITLTVIGVVAALTIPTLLQNTNQAELKTALKREVADFSQAAIQITNDNGGSLVNIFNSHDDIANAFNAKLNTIKTCSGTSSPGNCFHDHYKWQYLNGISASGWNYPGAILTNGDLVMYRFDSKACTAGANNYCGLILVDVNGFKKPNMVGKDIFTAWIKSGSIIPLENTGASSCDTANYGYGCSSLYLYQ